MYPPSPMFHFTEYSFRFPGALSQNGPEWFQKLPTVSRPIIRKNHRAEQNRQSARYCGRGDGEPGTEQAHRAGGCPSEALPDPRPE